CSGSSLAARWFSCGVSRPEGRARARARVQFAVHMATTTPARRDPARDLTAPRHQALGSLLGRVWAVDQVGVQERAASLAKRSIKRDSKLWALDMIIRMTDLTTLEGKDTPGKIRALAGKARRPDPTDPSIPSVAALCVYPAMVPEARAALEGAGVDVASMTT